MTLEALLAFLHQMAGLPRGGELENMLKVAINSNYMRLLNLVKGGHETREFTLTTVASTGTYGMPLVVRKITYIEDTTARKTLFDISEKQFVETYPGTTDSGTPELARPYGTFGVEKQPSAAGTIGIVSDDADDDGANYIVVVVGLDASNVPIREEVEADGLTKASTTKSFTKVERVVKAPASGTTFDGQITVTDGASNTIAVIPTWWDSPDYEWVEFNPVPSAAETYIVGAEMRKPPLVEAEDWPEIDSNFHDLIWRGVVEDIFAKIGFPAIVESLRPKLKDRFDEFLSSHGEPPKNRALVMSNVWNTTMSSGARPRNLRHSVQVSS